MHTDVRFIEKSKKRKNFVVSGNSSYFACDCLYADYTIASSSEQPM